MTDSDYTDNLAFLANSPAKTESQLHSLEQATEYIGINVNVDKTLIKQISFVSNWKKPTPH